ncbi:MAG: aminotransferase class V-fold PLP-dependent enzyme [Candidatus Tectomicrobia bacterium]|nr:aminotransferase class V-fold PLP-dependent enzyme [Candidatus Tectomicrobia bacterium]
MNVEELRKDFPITQECAWLNHAAHTPPSNRVVGAMIDYLRKLQHEPKYSAELGQIRDQVRQLAARLINAEPEEIAFIQNTSTGISIAATSLDLKPGDNVVFTDMEYPANAYPWMNLERQKGVEARIIPNREGGLTLEDLEKYVDSNTKVVAVSSVEFLTGFRTDLKKIGEFCKERGIYFVVDAIQSLGMLPMDVKACQIDILATGGQKWLMGPGGIGFFYCRKDLIEKLTPIFAGASSVINAEEFLDYDLTFLPDARRFQTGSGNTVGMVGLGATVSFFLEVGVENIEKWTLYLTGLLAEQLQKYDYKILSSLNPERRSAILTFGVDDVNRAAIALKENNVVISVRGDGKGNRYIRVSPHCYNTEDEVLKVVDVLNKLRD